MVPTLAFDCLAVLVSDRALEHIQLAGLDGGFRVHRHFLHVIWHICVGRHRHHSRIQAAKGVLGSTSALAASASLPGSNQVFTQMIFTLMSGRTDWAPSIIA